MKKLLLFLLLFTFLVSPAWGRDLTGDAIKPGAMVEAETSAYMSLPSPALDIVTVNNYIRNIKYGSGVTLTSQTLNLSTVAGSVFASNPLTDHRWMKDFRVTYTDTAAQTLVFWGGNPGTGETLDTEMISNGSGWTGGPPPTGWTAAGNTLAALADSGPLGAGDSCLQLTRVSGTTSQAWQDVAGFVTGKLYKKSVYVKAGTGGNKAYRYGFTTSGFGSWIGPVTIGTLSASWVKRTDYWTSDRTATLSAVLEAAGADVETALFDEDSTVPILTPSATGIYGLSTQGGSTYASIYPTQSDTYVKATTKYSTDYWPYYATDPTKSLTGAGVGNSWASGDSVNTNQRFHIDLGLPVVIGKIYYENFHISGIGPTAQGVKNFTFWGSNTAGDFADLTYADDGTWVQLATSQTTFDQHIGLDQADPKYITVTNTTAYRYYAFKFADNWGGTKIGVRRIELQSSNGYVSIGATFNPNATSYTLSITAN